MIIGIGTDIVNISRIEGVFLKFGPKFIDRILGAQEKEHFNKITSNDKQISYLAKRFAAKEATSKALGAGIGRGLRFTDIEILNNDLGKPEVSIPESHIKSLCITTPKFYISLADDYPNAIAFVVISS